MSRKLTAEDLEQNPELAAKGFQEGDDAPEENANESNLASDGEEGDQGSEQPDTGGSNPATPRPKP
jgi:hypothetical protein